MRLKKVYCITWIQRTTVHLKELYYFFNHQFQKLPFANTSQLAEHYRLMKIRNPSIFQQIDYEILKVQTGKYNCSFHEDGVFMVSGDCTGLMKSKKDIEIFYTERLGPLLSCIFKSGAPLPKELSAIEAVYPIVFIVDEASEADVMNMYTELHEVYEHSVSSKTTQIFFGERVMVLRCIRADKRREGTLEELLGNIIFLHEFEHQLQQYLNLHRKIWDEITNIRDSANLRYKDFPSIRRTLLEGMKTLCFVKARLAQMGDYAAVRQKLLLPEILEELKECRLDRFENVLADQKYFVYLWDMTTSYAEDTLNLLESLFQENTQRELNALKYITLLSLLTGFFGMNIAFPWEDRWPTIYLSSWLIIGIMIVISIALFFGMKFMIYRRRFILQH